MRLLAASRWAAGAQAAPALALAEAPATTGVFEQTVNAMDAVFVALDAHRLTLCVSSEESPAAALPNIIFRGSSAHLVDCRCRMR